MTDLLISGLLKRRSEMAADIAHMSGRLAQLQSDLVKIDAALGVLGCEIDGEFLPAKKPTTAGLFRQKELPLMIYAELGKAPQGLQIAEIADNIIRAKGWEPDDPRFVGAIREKISRTLNKLHQRRHVVLENGLDGRFWRRKPLPSAR